MGFALLRARTTRLLVVVSLSVSCFVSLAIVRGSRLNADSNSPISNAESSEVANRSVESTTEKIDRRLSAHWRELDLKPAAEATDGEWCRRVYLDLIGRIPKTDELHQFVNSRKRDKRAALVDRLLSPEYSDEYASHWATVWGNLLIGRRGADRGVVSREGMREYLIAAFSENRSYDSLVRDLITASGGNSPDHPDFNGAVNFLSGKLNEDAIQATAKTASLFLGVRVECTQCHAHPFNAWKQNQFWELNSFFRQARLVRMGMDDDRFAILEDDDFRGEGGTTPEEAEVYYELRSGLLKSAYPVFIDGREATSKSGRVQDISRRKELANLVVSAEEFPRAIVNRMWAHFFGYGFTRPIDDMGPHNAPVLPELLNELASNFRASSYDLKELARCIVLSDAYGLSSRVTRGNKNDEPANETPPAFSHFYARQMSAEQLYESLLTATAADQTAQSNSERDDIRERWLDQFVTSFGTDDGAERSLFDGTIPQTLMMMNGDLMARATNCEPGSFLHRIATNGGLSNEDKLDQLYLAAVARKPSKHEIQVANELLSLSYQDDPDDDVFALQCIWWALLNSNEFILNH